jgi:predicted membrane-bound spermidine synthase
VDSKNGELAKRMLITGSPLYERAFGKLAATLNESSLSGEERAALAVGSGGTGGFAVPFQLGPTDNPDREWRLKLVVFVSGAVLMALEMTGSRVLAIHFGSSIYVWGAIIGIFLAALSLGYYSGGMLADKKPTFFLLNLLLLIAGFWLMLIPFYANATCRAVLRLNPGERLGPLLSTTILFGGPSVLLGMVSPYSVRLAARELERMGNVSGRLYALSTFGSIAGTLLTAFWLIPAAGVRLLLQVLGLCLVVLPLVVLPGSNKRRALSLGSLALAPLLIFLNLKTVTPLPPQQALVYEGDSPYHYIKVVDDKQGNTRFLQFNNYVEGAIDLSPPYETRVSYTNAFQLARIFKRDLQHILIIGGGGGIGARKFVADDERVVVDLVEIDPQVVDLSSKYFYLEPGPRLRSTAPATSAPTAPPIAAPTISPICAACPISWSWPRPTRRS